MVLRQRCGTLDLLFYQNARGHLQSVPASWTDIDDPDPFFLIAEGMAHFRVEDLLTLEKMIRSIREKQSSLTATPYETSLPLCK